MKKTTKIISLVFLSQICGTIFASSLMPQPILEKHKDTPHKTYETPELIGQYSTEPVELKNSDKKFLVKTRIDQLKRRDCESCHAPGIDLKALESGTHANISIAHAKDQGMSCQTCHHWPEVKNLRNANNDEKISMNHAYQSCQGCHFTQAKDWAGGAHGKRVLLWAEPRIVYNCTECHNPHKPHFEKRWPKTVSTLPETKKK